MARHSKRDDYSRPNVSPLVTAMRAYLMWEYGDEVPVEPAAVSAPSVLDK
jgi:hypothetical protein